jgi:hypothetical protein
MDLTEGSETSAKLKEGFENFQTKIHNDNSRLVEEIESNNVRLSETLKKQFREENENLRAELSS